MMSQVRVVVNSFSPEADHSTLGPTLFKDIKFFILQRVPQRSTFVQSVEANGGEVVRLEKHADIIIGDHVRKDNPAGTYSYRWIEQSISEARLVDKEPYLCGPAVSSSRSVGALRPAKGSRVPYSKEDDIQLYKWVKDREASGERVQGNELYKTFEKLNDRHPWQSWRDRYIKKLQYQPPISSEATNPRTQGPVSDLEETVNTTNQHRPSSEEASTLHSKPTEPALQQEKSPVQTPQDTELDFESPKTSEKTNSEPTTGAEPEKRKVSTVPVASPRVLERFSETPVQSGAKKLLSTDNQGRQIPSRNSFGANARPFTPKQGQKRVSLSNVTVDHDKFTAAEHWQLMEWARDIQHLTVRDYEKAWRAYGEKDPSHSALEWEKFYEDEILPVWEVFEEDRDSMAESEGFEPEPSLEEWVDFLGRKVKPLFERYVTARGTLNHTGSPEPDLITNHISHSDTGVDSFARHFVRLSRLKRKPEATESILEPLSSPISPTRHRKMPRLMHPDGPNLNDNVGESLSPQDDSSKEEEAEAEVKYEEPEESHEDGVSQIHTTKMSGLPFDIYESREIPEGEEENMIRDEFGNLSFPEKHKHVRRDDALDAFQDNSQYFTLVPTPELYFKSLQKAIEYGQRNTSHFDLTSKPEDTESDENESSSAFDTPPTQPRGNEQGTINSDQSQYHDAHESGQRVQDDGATGPNTFSINPSDSVDNHSQPLEVEQVEENDSDSEEMNDIERDDMDESELDESNESSTEELFTQPHSDQRQDITPRRNMRNNGKELKTSQSAEATDIYQTRNSLPLDSSPLAAKASANRHHSQTTVNHTRAPPSKLQITEEPAPIVTSSPTVDNQPLEASEPSLFVHDDDDLDESASIYTMTSEADISQFEQFIADQTDIEGHKREVVDWALHVTSCNMELAAEVLSLKRRHRRLPTNTKGIWHEQDDKDLLSGDEPQLRRLRMIHGKEGVRERREFLEL